MKGIVAFDSVYGNTRKVAEAIAEEIRAQGHEVEVYNLGEKVPRLAKGDFVFVGSPTRMGRMTGRTKKFVKRLDQEHFASRTVVPFDTIMTVPEDPEKRQKALKWTEHGAAIRIKELADRRGLKVNEQVLRVNVSGLKGPLVPEALDQAREFTRAFLTQ
jgi:menaquinone-dependent protoporphyrinogen IX oxidase